MEIINGNNYKDLFVLYSDHETATCKKQEAGIKSESALPYERLDIYFHNEDCLAQISWDEI